MDRKKQRCGTAFAAAIILLMIGASVLFHDKEIIFPEIAALATGVFLTPHLLWKDTGPVKFLLLMTASAVFGIGLTMLVPVPLVRVVLGCVFTLVCLTVFRSGLYPMLSACVLPALLNITSVIYPVSVFCCSLAIVLARQWMGKLVGDSGFETIESGANYLSREELLPKVMAGLLVLLYSIVPCLLQKPLLIAPPLFVLFFELYTEDKKQAGREFQVLLLAVLCCVTGAVSALLIQHRLAWGPLPAGIFTVAVLFFLMKKFGIYMPPVAALSFLPLILPAERLPLYPVYTGISLTVIVLFVYAKRTLVKKAQIEHTVQQ